MLIWANYKKATDMEYFATRRVKQDNSSLFVAEGAKHCEESSFGTWELLCR